MYIMRFLTLLLLIRPSRLLREYGLHIPVITTLHGTDITLVGKNQAYEPVVRFSIDKSEGVTAVSEYLRQATLENFPIQKDIRVIPNFIDIERFKHHNKDHFRKMLTSSGEKILIHTSNFRKVKRIPDVIRTFEKVRRHIPARLMMVGDGPERRHAEELCREMKLCEDIVFLGSQNAVEEIYSVGDLFLMPSANESFGLAALEAMACAVPVISSRAGGLPELVIDGKTGFNAEIGDVEMMATRALELLTDDMKWKQFSDQALAYAQTFDRERVVPVYESYYEEILQKSGSLV